MQKINMRRVLVGGLIAGAVLCAIDVAMYGAVLKAPMAVAWKAVGRPAMTDTQRDLEVPLSLLFDFAAGVVLMWVYAAIRPRFGGGAVTALRAGLATWLFASILCAGFSAQGIMPPGVLIITTLVLLAEYPLAVVIGARFYSEGSA